jgi:integrase
MPLKIYKRGNVWHYRGTVAKRRLRGSTGASNKETALRITAEIEDRAWKRRLDGPGSVLTFAQAAIKYRAVGKQTRFLEKIEDYWKNTLVKNITAGAIRDAALVLYPNATGATRNRQAIVPMQAVINHAADSELCARIRVKRFKVETKSKLPATLEWIEAFRRACKRPQLGALALFMFLTGARVSEALAVEWEDVNFKERTVLIKQTKLGNERRSHLPQSLIVVLANLPRSNSGRGVFWYETRNHCLMAWRRAALRAKIAPLSMHSCRHGFATALLRKKVDVVTVAKLGGWKSARHVLDTYGHAIDDITLTDLIAGPDLTQPTHPDSRKPRKTGTSRT